MEKLMRIVRRWIKRRTHRRSIELPKDADITGKLKLTPTASNGMNLLNIPATHCCSEVDGNFGDLTDPYVVAALIDKGELSPKIVATLIMGLNQNVVEELVAMGKLKDPKIVGAILKDKLAKELDESLASLEADHIWVEDNMPNKRKALDQPLDMNGFDIVEVDGVQDYLRHRLKGVVLERDKAEAESGTCILFFYHSITHALAVRDLIQSLHKSSKAVLLCYHIATFASLEVHKGGQLRASVAIVMAMKISGSSKLASVSVVKTVFDIAKGWKSSTKKKQAFMKKAKSWAKHKAISYYKSQMDAVIRNVEYGLANVMSME
jgi:hypothetical protein